MKKQYQEEYSQVHVPIELLEKTKLSMKEEQNRIETEKEKRRVSFGRVPIAVASVIILLLIIPGLSGVLRSDGEVEEQKMQMHISDKEERELQLIPKEDNNWLEAFFASIKEFFD